ncbi:unnamed protein product, partial [Mesorhabditis spiculigera]
MRWPLLLLSLLALRACASEVELDEEEGAREDWIDPNDPTFHLKISSPGSALQASCEATSPVEPTLKLILRSLFRQMHVAPAQKVGFYRVVSAQLSDYDVAVIDEYLEAPISTPVQRDNVRNIIANIFQIVDLGLDSPSKWQIFIRMFEPWLAPLNLLVALLAFVFFLTRLFSRGSLLKILLLIIFVVSLFTSYNRMYQEKMAERIAESMKRDDACKPQGLFTSTLSYLKNIVQVQRKSECLKFIEAQTVSVIFEISPMDVLFDVIGNSFFSLMEHFAARLNRATLALFDGLPIHLQIGLGIGVPVMSLIVFLFGVVQYRIGFFGIRFEPANANNGVIGQIGNAVGNVIEALDPARLRLPIATCTCSARTADCVVHSFECGAFPQIDLNRGKPPALPKQDVNLRRPDGLWANAPTTDGVDPSSPEEQMRNINQSIERFLSVGDNVTALYWIDVQFATQRQDGESYVYMAQYVQNLSRVGAWERVITFTEERLLHETHLLFAYFYISALSNLKLFSTIMNAKIGHLIELEAEDLNFEKESPIPLRFPVIAPYMQRTDIRELTAEEKTYLDEKSKELRLLSAFLCRLGKAFLAVENRTAALRFIWTAWLRDKYNMEAEELINRYNFAEGKKRQQQWEKFINRRTYHSPPNDPRSLFVQAQQQFANNNVKAAYNYTKLIMNHYGIYKPALLIHVNCAVSLKDTKTLFTLAHDLVDRSPHDEISWYTVALYYFVIGNNATAKNFMNKTTMMNRAFGEAWVAFGHILSAENEHEQAMNCYLKALRLLDRHQDLFVFLAMEYCRTNNVKWAMDFLKDPQLYPQGAEGAKPSPYREHERGCVHYTQKQWSPALSSFTRALRTINPEAIEKNGKYVKDQIMQIDTFWEPLISNMAHVQRRIGNYDQALILYECASLLHSEREQTVIGHGLALASMGDLDSALHKIHRALSINPYNIASYCLFF